jgi:hypothetical protein
MAWMIGKTSSGATLRCAPLSERTKPSGKSGVGQQHAPTARRIEFQLGQNGPMTAKALTSALSKPIDRAEIEAPDPSIEAIPPEMMLESKHA